jgi:hypothetical protein
MQSVNNYVKKLTVAISVMVIVGVSLFILYNYLSYKSMVSERHNRIDKSKWASINYHIQVNIHEIDYELSQPFKSIHEAFEECALELMRLNGKDHRVYFLKDIEKWHYPFVVNTLEPVFAFEVTIEDALHIVVMDNGSNLVYFGELDKLEKAKFDTESEDYIIYVNGMPFG